MFFSANASFRAPLGTQPTIITLTGKDPSSLKSENRAYLREEAHKFWDYVISDEVVYLGQPVEPNLETGVHLSSQNYLHGDFWFEIHISFIEESGREVHLQAIAENFNKTFPLCFGDRKAGFKSHAVDGDDLVFIDIPEFIQLPKGMLFRSSLSFIGLKIVNNFCCCGWKKLQQVSVLPTVLLTNGKTDLPRSSFIKGKSLIAGQVGDAPGQLIQGRSKTTDEIADQKRQTIGSACDFELENMDSMFKIIVLPNGVRFAIHPAFANRMKLFQAFVRPIGLQIDIKQGMLWHQVTVLESKYGRQAERNSASR